MVTTAPPPGRIDPAFWAGKRVLLTGHTGFKGGWLAHWLAQLGARVSGFALPPPTTPNFYTATGVASRLDSTYGDLREPHAIAACMHQHTPQIILHLAAQPLVSAGYHDPVGTYATNVMGSVHLLNACRKLPDLEAVVMVTTDKVYANHEWAWGYRETDPLGGKDPYAGSKACVELLCDTWRQAFFAFPDAAKIVTARAGNVIGGGDWADHRLVPDLLRAFAREEVALLRHPDAIRPWQHVLEPLSGYLLLAQTAARGHMLAPATHAWNFGPHAADCVPVGDVANRLARCWGDDNVAPPWSAVVSELPPESATLRLDASLAQQQLGWYPRWTLDEALTHTVAWHRGWLTGADLCALTTRQIADYQSTDRAPAYSANHSPSPRPNQRHDKRP